jgi:hypothetical protein
MFTRREFLEATGAATLAGRLAWADQAADGGRKKLAIIATVWKYLSHAQHIGDRFLVGYPHDGKWHHPQMDVVSLYVDQKPEGDQSGQRAKEFGFQVYPTIAQALRRGGDKLAVDAVLIIAEDGDYPRNRKGQILYPRYEFFRQVTDVFEKDGRAVPVFNDKHLSYSLSKAKKMVAASQRLDFPMLAGSVLPVTWRLPSLELPLGCELEEALMVGAGSSDSSDYHALEAMQCMVERRKGGEAGVKSVQLIEGDAVWKAGEQGRWSKELLESALSRSDLIEGLTLVDARPQDLVNNGELPKIVKNPAAYFIEHSDGLQTTLLMLNGGVGDFTFAARVKGMSQPQSTQFLLPPPPNVASSACLAAKIEEMIETGRPPYPVQRTLLVSGILESCLESKLRNHRLLKTPDLDIRYQAPQGSHFCRS